MPSFNTKSVFGSEEVDVSKFRSSVVRERVLEKQKERQIEMERLDAERGPVDPEIEEVSFIFCVFYTLFLFSSPHKEVLSQLKYLLSLVTKLRIWCICSYEEELESHTRRQYGLIMQVLHVHHMCHHYFSRYSRNSICD
jgi:hypothetical protein